MTLLTVRQRNRILWRRPLCMIVITKATKSQSKNSSNMVRSAFSLQLCDHSASFYYQFRCHLLQKCFYHFSFQFSSVQSLSHVRLFATPWIAACQASLSITNSRSSRPSSQWCHPAISSSVIPFSSCPQPLPASESFPMSQLFAWGGQSTGVSALASLLPKSTQDRSPLEWTGWISLQFWDSQESSPTPQSINSLVLSFLHSPTLTSIHDHWKNHILD